MVGATHWCVQWSVKHVNSSDIWWHSDIKSMSFIHSRWHCVVALLQYDTTHVSIVTYVGLTTGTFFTRHLTKGFVLSNAVEPSPTVTAGLYHVTVFLQSAVHYPAVGYNLILISLRAVPELTQTLTQQVTGDSLVTSHCSSSRSLNSIISLYLIHQSCSGFNT